MAKKKKKVKEVTISETEFEEVLSSVAARLCVEADEHGVSGIKFAIMSALLGAELHKALFTDERLEVEE